MPTRRKNKTTRHKRYKYKNVNRPKKRVVSYKSVLFLAIIAIVVLSFSFWPRSWQKDSKLAMVIDSRDGDVYVSVFNPETKEVVNIIIPSTVEVESARQLGTFRLGAIWQLGVNEDVDGKVLAETITNNFKLPVTQWANSDYIAFANGELKSMLVAVIMPNKTSLKLRDRLQLFFFSVRVKEFKRKDILLANTNVLNKKILLDGEEGYEIAASMPQSILSVFSNQSIASSNMTITIKDHSGRYGVSDEVGEIVQVLGAKVASISKEDEKDIYCEVVGDNIKAVSEIANLFSCSMVDESTDDSFDIEIRIGKQFADRF